MDYSEITPEIEAQLWAELRKRITPEFMETLKLAAIAVGYTCQYDEVADFIKALGDEIGIPTEPFQVQKWPHNFKQ